MNRTSFVDKKLMESMEYIKTKLDRTFESIEEMYEAVNGYLKGLSDRDAKVLQFIADHARNVIGVAKLLNKTIQDGTGLSYDQVKRAIRSLRDKGILAKEKAQDFKRSADRTRKVFGASRYVIVVPQPIEEELLEESDDELINESAVDSSENNSTPPIAPQNRTTELHNGGQTESVDLPTIKGTKKSLKSISKSYLKSFSYIKRYSHSEIIKIERLDKSFTDERVPEEFINMVGSYFDDSEQIENLWNKTEMVARTYCYELTFYEIKEAFRTSIKALKAGKIRKGSTFDDFIGYFYGTLTKIVLTEIRRQTNFGYNWLDSTDQKDEVENSWIDQARKAWGFVS